MEKLELFRDMDGTMLNTGGIIAAIAGRLNDGGRSGALMRGLTSHRPSICICSYRSEISAYT
jgi:hypothetical protein